MSKGKLDGILEAHKAQPVGHGYIDIIVNRENYRAFVQDLVLHGYKIENISWWEWCPGGKKAAYGIGGPKSRYYDGWFSELSIPIDDIDIIEEKQIERIINMIETKSISFPNKIVTFNEDDWLTPAIWIVVPSNWRNEMLNTYRNNNGTSKKISCYLVCNTCFIRTLRQFSYE